MKDEAKQPRDVLMNEEICNHDWVDVQRIVLMDVQEQFDVNQTYSLDLNELTKDRDRRYYEPVFIKKIRMRYVHNNPLVIQILLKCISRGRHVLPDDPDEGFDREIKEGDVVRVLFQYSGKYFMKIKEMF